MLFPNNLIFINLIKKKEARKKLFKQFDKKDLYTMGKLISKQIFIAKLLVEPMKLII